MLGKKAIEDAINRGLVTEFVNARTQTTDFGFELTLKSLKIQTTSGSVAFTASEESAARLEDVEFTGIGGYARVNRDQSFTVEFNEMVKIPIGQIGKAYTIKSVLDSGVVVDVPILKPGFEGYPTALLTVHNSRGFAFKKDARLVVLTIENLE